MSSDTQSKTLTIEAGWDIVPATDAQQSLGSPTQRFTDIYIDNSTINIGNNTLEADADQDVVWNGAKLSTVSYVDDAIATALTGGTVDLSTYVTETELTTALSNYQPTVDLSAYALKTELFSGNYNDLANAPTIPSLEGYASIAYVDSKVAQEVSSAVSSIDTSSFVTEIEMDSAIQTAVNAVPVFSGQYADLIGKPAIFSVSYLDLTNRPVLFNGDYNNLINKPDLSTFATEEYVTEQVAGALTGGTVDLSGYVTDVEMATAIGASRWPDDWSRSKASSGGGCTVAVGQRADLPDLERSGDRCRYRLANTVMGLPIRRLQQQHLVFKISGAYSQHPR